MVLVLLLLWQVCYSLPSTSDATSLQLRNPECCWGAVGGVVHRLLACGMLTVEGGSPAA
jgi:hypothetical protein